MKRRVIGASIAAALLGLSTASFAQSTTTDSSGTAVTTPGTTVVAPNATVTTPGATVSNGTTVTNACDNLSGRERTRCLREQASTGSSAVNPGVPATQEPAQSGPGAVDKTMPGREPTGRGAINPNDAGTSSAGSN